MHRAWLGELQSWLGLGSGPVGLTGPSQVYGLAGSGTEVGLD